MKISDNRPSFVLKLLGLCVCGGSREMNLASIEWMSVAINVPCFTSAALFDTISGVPLRPRPSALLQKADVTLDTCPGSL